MTGLSVVVGLVPVAVVLALCLPVLVDIVRDGRERRRKWKSGELERYAEDTAYDAGPPSELSPDGGTQPSGTVTCPFCGAANDREFAVCRRCAQWV